MTNQESGQDFSKKRSVFRAENQEIRVIWKLKPRHKTCGYLVTEKYNHLHPFSMAYTTIFQEKAIMDKSFHLPKRVLLILCRYFFLMGISVSSILLRHASVLSCFSCFLLWGTLMLIFSLFWSRLVIVLSFLSSVDSREHEVHVWNACQRRLQDACGFNKQWMFNSNGLNRLLKKRTRWKNRET